jgi:hypothetical protein
MALLESFNKGKNIGFAGLCDVSGGKMWFVYDLYWQYTYYFWTKAEAYECVRNMECNIRGYKKLLRQQLSKSKGRAVRYV